MVRMLLYSERSNSVDAYIEKLLSEGGNSEDRGGEDVLGSESSWIDEG